MSVCVCVILDPLKCVQFYDRVQAVGFQVFSAAVGLISHLTDSFSHKLPAYTHRQACAHTHTQTGT